MTWMRHIGLLHLIYFLENKVAVDEWYTVNEMVWNWWFSMRSAGVWSTIISIALLLWPIQETVSLLVIQSLLLANHGEYIVTVYWKCSQYEKQHTSQFMVKWKLTSLCGPLHRHDFHIQHPWEAFCFHKYEPVGLRSTNITRKADAEIAV